MTALRWRERRSERATAVLMATSQCIIFHTVNMASTCQGPGKFGTRSPRGVLFTCVSHGKPWLLRAKFAHVLLKCINKTSQIESLLLGLRPPESLSPSTFQGCARNSLNSNKVAKKSPRLTSSNLASKDSSCRIVCRHSYYGSFIDHELTNWLLSGFWSGSKESFLFFYEVIISIHAF